MLEQYRMVCKTYEYVVGLVKHLNGTRETYDARMRLFYDKLDIIFERLNTQAASAKKTAFPTRPKRLRDLPAFLFRDRYTVIFFETASGMTAVIMVLLSIEIGIYL